MAHAPLRKWRKAVPRYILSRLVFGICPLERTAEEAFAFLCRHGILPKISGGYHEQ